MSPKITVKRTKKYVRFFCEKKEILLTYNIYTSEDTDETLIKYCLRPWLVDFLKENRSELEQSVINTNQLTKDIAWHQKALDAARG